MRIRRTIGTAILGVLSIALLQNRAGAQWTCDTAAFDDSASPWVSSLPCVMTIEESLSETDSLRFVRAAHEVLVEASSVEKIIRPRTKLEVFPPDLNISLLSPDSVHGQYDLVEISIEFPERLDTLFRNHFMNSYITEWTESWGNEALDFSYCDTCRLNPFDPDVADVWLISERWDDSLEEWVDPKRTNAFYYVQFDRNHNVTSNYMAHDSLGYFDWTPLPNQPEFLHQNREFRGRLAYRDSGTYRITARAWAEGYHQSEPVIVQVVHSESPGYVRVDPENPTFLSFENGELHYPCGPNIQVNDRRSKTPLVGSLQEVQLDFVYNNECQIVDTLIDSLAWCKLNQTQWGTSEWGPIPLHQAYFLALHDEMDKIAAAGVKTCRTMPQPWSYEWEYENLGDYSPSMHRAFELDQLIEKASEVGIVIQWDLFAQTAITHRSYGNRFWSWGKVDQDPDTIPERSYCYHDELGLNDPIEFIQDPTSKAWFKKRLRYFYARYGWSPNIGVIELRSESSGIEWMNAEGTIRHPYYDGEPNLKSEYVGHVQDWHQEMASFIRESLDENNHPLALSYLTDGMDSTDVSYEYVDVYCQSCYGRDIYAFAKDYQGETFESSPPSEMPKYCSEMGFGRSIWSPIGRRNVQLIQTVIASREGSGAGFDWFGTAGVDSSILRTQQILSNFIDTCQFLKNELPRNPATTPIFLAIGGSSSMNDSLVDFGMVFGDPSHLLNYGLIFNKTFSQEDVLDTLVSNSIGDWLCPHGLEWSDVEQNYGITEVEFDFNDSLWEQLVGFNSKVVDPISGVEIHLDSLTIQNGDIAPMPRPGNEFQFALYTIWTDALRSQTVNVHSNFTEIPTQEMVDIPEVEQIQIASLYPNPSRDLICIRIDSPEERPVGVYNAQGNWLTAWPKQELCMQIDHLAPAIYFVKNASGEVKKFIVQ